jgi:hypothetical protein
VLVRTSVTSEKDLWIYCVKVPVGTKGVTSAQGN